MAEQNLTTKICSKCRAEQPLDTFANNIRTKDGLSYWCVICMRAYRAANYDRLIAKQRAHRVAQSAELNAQRRKAYAKDSGRTKQANRESYQRTRQARVDYQRAYRKANPEKLRERKRKEFQAHKSDYVERARAWRHANPERANEYSRKWRLTHPEARRTSHTNNKAKRKQAKGSHTPEQWLAKCEYHGWRCIYCRVPVTHKTVHVEHRKPLSKGGSNFAANIAPACVRCNLSKNSKTEAEYRRL